VVWEFEGHKVLLENLQPGRGTSRFVTPLTACSMQLEPMLLGSTWLPAPTHQPTGETPASPDQCQCCCLLLGVGILQGAGERGAKESLREDVMEDHKNIKVMNKVNAGTVVHHTLPS